MSNPRPGQSSPETDKKTTPPPETDKKTNPPPETTNNERRELLRQTGHSAILVGLGVVLFYGSYAIRNLSTDALTLTFFDSPRIVPAETVSFWLQLVGLILFLVPVGRGFAQYLARLREQSDPPVGNGKPTLEKARGKTTEGLIEALNTERGHLQVGSWWVFNLALVVLAVGVGLATRDVTNPNSLFAPVSLVAFSSALLTTFWFMRRRVAFLADRIYILRAHYGEIGNLALLQTFFTPYQSPDIKMVKAFDSARKIVEYAREVVSADLSTDDGSPRRSAPVSSARATESGDNGPPSTT